MAACEWNGYSMQQITSFKSKKDLVYEHLRTEILRGTFAPGDRIVIDGLAAQLGVSQIPIREALQQLQAEGFVVIEPHIGPRVAEIHVSLICEIFQLLEALEIISSQAACQRMNQTNLDGMETILQRMDALKNDPEQWSQENEHLHSAICDWAGTGLVKNLMGNVLDQWDRLRHYYLRDVFIYGIDQS
jgi:DNA-binding GntR family transcriptional regulator